ncbi:tautomerase family protein [Niallia sp. 01092]|uniref:tautomerase family protein n=1 Tax=unclassified Niallia TaxID=2837522 RepID=UPI003FD2E313
MAQIKIYGFKDRLNSIKEKLSNVIHSCIVEAFKYPLDKKVQRFFPMDKDNFCLEIDRTEAYTIIEISVFEGRTVQAKKQLIHLLFDRISSEFHISPKDIEITIFETPKHNWGIRGLSGDELKLNYEVNI